MTTNTSSKKGIIKWGDWEGIYDIDGNFCPDCFIRFLPLTEEEIEYIEGYIAQETTYTNRDSQKGMVTFTSKSSDFQRVIEKNSSRHPLCPKHKHDFFAIEKYNRDMKKHTFHYRTIFRSTQSKILEVTPIENDNDIVGYAAPVRKILQNYSTNALTHNPTSYIYPKNNILFTCSGYDRNPIISERKAIMEGVERFSTFSPIDQSSSLIWTGPLETRNAVISQAIFPQYYSPINTANIAQVLAYNTGLDSCEFLPLEYFFLPTVKNYKPCLNYLNSVGCAAHLDPIGAANSAILELIERDALMRLWFFQYIPEEYNFDTQGEVFGQYTNSLDLKKYNIRIFKLRTHDYFVTLALLIGKTDNTLPYYFFGSGSGMTESESIKKSIIELISNFQNNHLYNFHTLNTDIDKIFDPSDHYLYYTDCKNFQTLRFLNSNQNKRVEIRFSSDEKNERTLIRGPYYLMDVTPNFLYKGIYVMRAYSPILQNMYFGLKTLRIIPSIRMEDVHPSVLTQPHPFS